MFMYIVSRLLTVWFAFLLPAYATVKALSSSPPVDSELRKWSMYWSVLAVVLAFEYVAEWLISWFPFYWELKMLFYLFLSLPQTDGSTYVYLNYLQPFCVKHREKLDASILAMRTNAGQFLKVNILKLRDIAMRTLNTSQPSGLVATIADGEMTKNIWTAYGSSRNTPNSTSAPRQFVNSESPSSSLRSTPAGTESTPPSFPVPQHF
ncbi:TB2/DP1, HVA22 family-domain-containing protein [Cyathus striatus]|nr:TB2/DP1, HVA22 family-domain-containing protein [Cyathus striatus]